MANRCNPKCIFFPIHSYEKSAKNFAEKNGLKYANNIEVCCEYDDHLIKSWENCENYRENYIFNTKPNKEKEKVIILMGKSAAGKDFILNYLKDNYKFNPIVSHTTRPIRENEVDGRDYYFIDIEDFSKMFLKQEFLETREYNTCFNGQSDIWYYGISKLEFDTKNKKICAVDITGQKEIIKYYGQENVISIFIDTDDELREQRAKLRGSFSKEEWDRRLKDDNKKFKKIKYDYIIKNNGTKEEFQKNMNKLLKGVKLI